MIHIRTDPSSFTWEQIKEIEQKKNARYLLETEHNGAQCAVFYGSAVHPISNSRYFAIFWTHDQHKWADVPAITDGSWIEDLEFASVLADNGDVIYSRHRHDFRESADGSVWIDGGRDYTRTNQIDRLRTLSVFKGRVEYWENYERETTKV